MERAAINELSRIVLDVAFGIHRKLGVGLSEEVYEVVMSRDLVRRGLRVERQKYISFDYEGLWFENAFRLDLLIENALVIEIKSASCFTLRDEKQLRTYLKITGYKLGLLINFGEPLLKDGIRRIANGL